MGFFALFFVGLFVCFVLLLLQVFFSFGKIFILNSASLEIRRIFYVHICMCLKYSGTALLLIKLILFPGNTISKPNKWLFVFPIMCFT